MRFDGRRVDELREIKITPGYIENAYRSVLIESGRTKVICTASVEEKLPSWLKGKGQGWVSAEYSMIPGATDSRYQREINKGKPSGRTQEIQRLIGRSLRAVTDLKKMPDITIWIDCDVIQADGGTRTASITGGFLALKMACQGLLAEGKIKEDPIKEHLAAVSAGVVNNEVVLDLPYIEDSAAQVDLNLVMTESGRFVEVQGTGEENTFTKDELKLMLEYGEKGIQELIDLQKSSLKKIVIASKNQGKIKEFKKILEPMGFQVYTSEDFPEIGEIQETGKSFSENALIKAKYVAKKLGMIVLADDSGLEVNVLGGAPGVYSARYAGEKATDEENNQKLLSELKEVGGVERQGRYVSALALYDPDNDEAKMVEGTCEGVILEERRGSGGFGYDSLFYIPSLGKTFAEIPLETKNRISHRGKALKKLKKIY